MIPLNLSSVQAVGVPEGAEGHKFVQRFRSFVRVPALKNYMSLSRLSACHRRWDTKRLLNYINVTSVVREWVAMGGERIHPAPRYRLKLDVLLVSDHVVLCRVYR